MANDVTPSLRALQICLETVAQILHRTCRRMAIVI